MKFNKILFLSILCASITLSACTQKQIDTIEDTHEGADELLETSIQKADDFESFAEELEKEQE